MKPADLIAAAVALNDKPTSSRDGWYRMTAATAQLHSVCHEIGEDMTVEAIDESRWVEARELRDVASIAHAIRLLGIAPADLLALVAAKGGE